MGRLCSFFELPVDPYVTHDLSLNSVDDATPTGPLYIQLRSAFDKRWHLGFNGRRKRLAKTVEGHWVSLPRPMGVLEDSGKPRKYNRNKCDYLFATGEYSEVDENEEFSGLFEHILEDQRRNGVEFDFFGRIRSLGEAENEISQSVDKTNRRKVFTKTAKDARNSSPGSSDQVSEKKLDQNRHTGDHSEVDKAAKHLVEEVESLLRLSEVPELSLSRANQQRDVVTLGSRSQQQQKKQQQKDAKVKRRKRRRRRKKKRKEKAKKKGKQFLEHKWRDIFFLCRSDFVCVFLNFADWSVERLKKRKEFMMV